MAETSNRSTHPPPYVEPEPQEFIEEPGTDLRYYWHVVWRRKWAILGLVIAAGVFSVVWAFSLQPIYRSTATLLIGGYDPVMNSGSDGSNERLTREKFFGTQVELLQSRQVLHGTLAQLQEQTPGFDPVAGDEKSGFRWGDWIPSGWLPGGAAPQAPVSESDADVPLLRWLNSGLSVQPVRDTSMVKVSFDSPSPALAARMANAVAEAYTGLISTSAWPLQRRPRTGSRPSSPRPKTRSKSLSPSFNAIASRRDWSMSRACRVSTPSNCGRSHSNSRRPVSCAWRPRTSTSGPSDCRAPDSSNHCRWYCKIRGFSSFGTRSRSLSARSGSSRSASGVPIQA